MLIYGAGGHARVVASILSACGESVQAVFDDRCREITVPKHDIARAYASDLMALEKLVIAIGNNADRRRIASLVTHAFGTAIHPTALVDGSTEIGAGTVIVHRAVVQAGSRIGKHVIVNTGAIVDHDCVVGDFAHIASGATLCGGVRVDDGTLVGAGSVVLPQVRIGKECVVGAGAVVVRDVPDYAKVAGNPARIMD